MLYVICFDISSHKVRRKVTKLLEGYGHRVQYSMFECWITAKQLTVLKKEIKWLVASGDKVNYFHLCGKDISGRIAIGSGELTHEQPHHII